MSPIMVSAPGKAIVAGEYAVLVGAPAISMALDSRAIVRIEAAKDEFHIVRTPGYADGEWRFRVSADGKLEWQDRHPELELIEAAWTSAVNGDPDPLAISVDTTAFTDQESGQKFGLGSSAAATTALVVALCQCCEQTAEPGALAYQAHASLQRGLGSGIDIATSLNGGVIEYRMHENVVAAHHSWPDNLLYRVIWSGHSADTPSHLRRLDTGSPTDRNWLPFIAAAENVAVKWAGADAAGMVESIRAYTATLHRFSAAQALGIFAGGHNEIYRLAYGRDVVYKPCGSGGGDIGIVLGTNSNSISSFCEAAGEHGFVELPVELDLNGVKVSGREQR